MATATMPKNPIANWEKVRDEWLSLLADLMTNAQAWAEKLGWATRLIKKRMDDSQIGPYEAPALLMQYEFTRVVMEPIARFAPGVEGVVDLYLMPAYDDIATILFQDGVWKLHYVFPGDAPILDFQEAKPLPFSKETMKTVLEDMRKNGA